MSRSVPTPLLARVLLPVALLSACAASAEQEAHPRPALASSSSSQAEFRNLTRSWHAADATARNALELPFRAFLDRYPDDDQTRLARAYLAWILIQKGELVEARQIVDATTRGPEGTARDFSQVVEAALLTQHGNPEEAMKILRPLQGKIIDPVERFLTTEQLVIAAEQAGLYSEALSYMVDWIEQSRASGRDGIRDSIRSRLRYVPHRHLERATETLEPRNSDPDRLENPQRFAHKQWLFEVITERLAVVAVQERDSQLAELVLDKNPSLSTSADAAELVKLATGGEPPATIAGRTIGLLISTTNASARKHSADVVSGVSAVLGYEGHTSGGVQLIFQEDGQSAADALAELAASGSALLIAGVDEQSAEQAALHAARTRAPVLLLSGSGYDNPYVFNVGVALTEQRALLADELAALGATNLRYVGLADGAPCGDHERGFPVAEWRNDGADSLSVFGDPECVLTLLDATSTAQFHPWFGLSLEAASSVEELSQERALIVRAGDYPMRKAAAPFTDFVAQFSRGPRWFEALGHDVAKIAIDVLSSLPEVRLQEASLVETHYDNVRDALAAYRGGSLWTTQQARFVGQHLSRELRAELAGRAQERKLP